MSTIRWSTAGLLIVCLGCGGETPEADAPQGAMETPPAKAAPTASAETDPCALAPIAAWEAATGATGLTHSRDGANTCDLLDDANARVAGSVGLISMSIYDGTVSRMEGEAVDGVGDDAFWVTMGPGMLYVKDGERALMVMVNPHGTTNHREAAVQLARTALGQ